jgi:hypothetical protein
VRFVTGGWVEHPLVRKDEAQSVPKESLHIPNHREIGILKTTEFRENSDIWMLSLLGQKS